MRHSHCPGPHAYKYNHKVAWRKQSGREHHIIPCDIHTAPDTTPKYNHNERGAQASREHQMSANVSSVLANGYYIPTRELTDKLHTIVSSKHW